MQIFQTSRDNENYRAVITSNKQIFASYEDIVRLADEFCIELSIVREQMWHDEFPPPINHDKGIDGAPEDGIWMYERVAHFIEWLSQNENYNPRIARNAIPDKS